MTLTTGYFVASPQLTVHREKETWWATCPLCPGFVTAADTWDDLYRFVADWHADPEAPHHNWTMVSWPIAEWTYDAFPADPTDPETHDEGEPA